MWLGTGTHAWLLLLEFGDDDDNGDSKSFSRRGTRMLSQGSRGDVFVCGDERSTLKAASLETDPETLCLPRRCEE
jgi:hypothetical protein